MSEHGNSGPSDAVVMLTGEAIDELDRAVKWLRVMGAALGACGIFQGIRATMTAQLGYYVISALLIGIAWAALRLASFMGLVLESDRRYLAKVLRFNHKVLGGVGLLLIALLLSLLRGAALPALRRSSLMSSQQAAADGMMRVSFAIDDYARERGRLPSAQDYPALRGELLAFGNAELPESDPWGHRIEYVASATGYTLSCLGRDGELGEKESGGDDIIVRSGVLFRRPPGVRRLLREEK